MQDHPGAPGSTPEGNPRTVVPAARGGAAAHHMAPGHDRPRAAPRAPDHDIPLTVSARAPGHDRLCAAHMVPDHNRSRAAHRAAPGRALASAGTSVPIATAPLPACVSRLLQVCLPRVAATPHTPIYPPSRHTAAKNRAASSHAPTHPPSRSAPAPGHPAILVPTCPQHCSVAGAGFPPQRQSRAPPHGRTPKHLPLSGGISAVRAAEAAIRRPGVGLRLPPQ